MKSLITAAMALAATAFASLASATTYTYTFDDMTYVPNNYAQDTFNTGVYWEQRATDRWGMVWETPYTFSTTFPSSELHGHFHIYYKDPSNCFDIHTGAPGNLSGSTCVPLNVLIHRGPFSTHSATQALYFQLIKDDYSMQPFVAKNIDVYSAATESINLYVRKTDGGWFQWSNLHGFSTGSPNYYRWILTSGYTGKFQVMAWMTVAGQPQPSSVGRVQITD